MEIFITKVKLLLAKYPLDIALQRVIKENDWLYNEIITKALWNHILLTVICFGLSIVCGRVLFIFSKQLSIAVIKDTSVNKKVYLILLFWIFLTGLVSILTLYFAQQSITIYRSPILYLIEEMNGRY